MRGSPPLPWLPPQAHGLPHKDPPVAHKCPDPHQSQGYWAGGSGGQGTWLSWRPSQANLVKEEAQKRGPHQHRDVVGTGAPPRARGLPPRQPWDTQASGMHGGEGVPAAGCRAGVGSQSEGGGTQDSVTHPGLCFQHYPQVVWNPDIPTFRSLPGDEWQRVGGQAAPLCQGQKVCR